jgi:hypothetical protein
MCSLNWDIPTHAASKEGTERRNKDRKNETSKEERKRYARSEVFTATKIQITLKMGATKSSETLVSYRNTAKRNSPEDQDLNF